MKATDSNVKYSFLVGYLERYLTLPPNTTTVVCTLSYRFLTYKLTIFHFQVSTGGPKLANFSAVTSVRNSFPDFATRYYKI